jgi:hypothetical protein
MTYGVQVPMPEALVAELGEEGALTIARHSADRIARREHGSSNLDTLHDVVQLVPLADPDTGARLPPMRLYRFTYR